MAALAAPSEAAALTRSFKPDKLNYLMLMMVDPDVHFHVLPRYASAREFAGKTHSDRFWPKPVDLTQPPLAVDVFSVLGAIPLRGGGRDGLSDPWALLAPQLLELLPQSSCTDRRDVFRGRRRRRPEASHTLKIL